ncbi:helix-turn-helix domain-containing protein [Chryseosolibacter indicus]|uniref:AraC family transcriptional regulator n=1 Tax=Chryseosolibacter indicus TaxID=2782351 RepID=A0ABS5VPK7_9BACT|nr:AraC family transcriptional regulator [Chryseosolibacter indicus]MBT1701956.1 AraC family transcriptional regulator [Chryseosolibacter indicus]
MNQFALQQGHSHELDMFDHIVEFGLTKNGTIQLESFPISTCDHIRIYYITDGKFEWMINQKHQILYPGDLAVVLPGQELGGSNRYLDIGTFFKLQLKAEVLESMGVIQLGTWSSLTESERITVGRILMTNNISVLKMKEAGDILYEMRSEVLNQEIGYSTRVNVLLDTLLIFIARQSTRQATSRRDFPSTFAFLEQALRKNLAHQWTVEEMAARVGLGTTAFTEKVKTYTGFSPLNYLINIRISEAIKLLKKQDINVTQIALDTGFYSSQHFSTTFKKLTGYTPGEFRKRNIAAK